MLKYRSSKTGFRELDLILGSFAEENLDLLSEKELKEYEQMLSSYSEADIYDFVTKSAARYPEEVPSIALKISEIYYTKTLKSKDA